MKQKLILAGVSAASLAVGAVGGYFFAVKQVKQYLKEEFDADFDKEVAKMKEEYRAFRKVDYTSPREAVEALVPEKLRSDKFEPDISSNDLERIATGLRYNGMFKGDAPSLPDKVHDAVFGDVADKADPAVEEVIFEELRSERAMDEFDEVVRDPEKKDKPYVITYEDFCNGSYDSITLTYFSGDETLMNEREEIVRGVNDLIGVGNLSKFGQGSEDPSIVYIRNEILEVDFEVVLDERTYKEVVAGFVAPNRKPNRRQDADE